MPSTKILRTIPFIFLFLFISGCSTKQIKTLPLENINAQKSHNENISLLKEKYGHEWKYNKGDKNSPPKLALSMSGGGTRSASFNIGVLKALYEQGILDEIDIISGVSGGTYAIYWFYSQHYYMDDQCEENNAFCYTTEDIFKAKEDIDFNGSKDSQNPLTEITKYRFQNHLENSSEIVNNFRGGGIASTIGNTTLTGVKALTWTLALPFHWIGNGLFDGDFALNPFVGYYRNGIERTYGLNPTGRSINKGLVKYSYSNDGKTFGIRTHADKLTFPRLRQKILELRDNGNPIPYFIINTTARYGRAFNKYDYRGDKENDAYRLRSVYEFTPEHQGSDMEYIGYRMVTSKNSKNFFMRFFENLDVFDLYGEVDDISHAVAISGAAVDAQAEQMGKIDSYFLRIFNLNQGLHFPNHNKNNASSGFYKLLPYPLYPLIENTVMKKPASVYMSDGGHSENLGVYSLIKRGVKNIIISDAESDNDSTLESAKKLKRRLKSELGLDFIILDNPGPLNVYNSKPHQSVMRAEVRGLKDKNGNDDIIKVTYIKLSMDQEKLDYNSNEKNKYPDTVIKFASDDSDFPHNSTGDIFYDKHQFRAYRDLGYSIGRELGIKKSGNNINITSPSKPKGRLATK